MGKIRLAKQLLLVAILGILLFLLLGVVVNALQDPPTIPEGITLEDLAIPTILGAVTWAIVQFLGIKTVAEVLAKQLYQFAHDRWDLEVDVYGVLVNLFALFVAAALTVFRMALVQEPIVVREVVALALAAWFATTTGYEWLKNLLTGIGLIGSPDSSRMRIARWEGETIVRVPPEA